MAVPPTVYPGRLSRRDGVDQSRADYRGSSVTVLRPFYLRLTLNKLIQGNARAYAPFTDLCKPAMVPAKKATHSARRTSRRRPTSCAKNGYQFARHFARAQ